MQGSRNNSLILSIRSRPRNHKQDAQGGRSCAAGNRIASGAQTTAHSRGAAMRRQGCKPRQAGEVAGQGEFTRGEVDAVRSNLTTPPTSTVSARPRTFQPANGQLRLFERNWLGSMVHSAAGSMTVTSATAPGLSVPRSMPSTLAGLIVSFSISCGQVRWPGSIRARDADRQQRLQADDAVGRLVQLAHLLLRRVRGVVGGDHLQRAVVQSGEDGLHVGVGAQRRRHLVIAVEGAQAVVGQREVVRAGFAGDADAAPLAPADQIDAAGRGDVQDVQRGRRSARPGRCRGRPSPLRRRPACRAGPGACSRSPRS